MVYFIELVGMNKIDAYRAHVVNGLLKTIVSVNNAGIDSVVELEENTRRLAELIKTNLRNTPPKNIRDETSSFDTDPQLSDEE
jgi:hypothetical protein